MNVYAYRMPGTKEAVKRVSDMLILHNESDCRPGFVFSTFLHSDRIFKIVEGEEISGIPAGILEENEIELPDAISTKERHGRYVGEIISSLKDDENKKVVAARALRLNKGVDPDILFDRITETYPDAFVFFISTKEFGNWIGASPELLIERNGNDWMSMALAGTRPKNTGGDWDFKNRKEQEIVADYIKSLFILNGLEINEIKEDTFIAGPVEHIRTLFKARGIPKNGPLNFISELSPTPALCGFPKKEAIQTITKWEGESRKLYGGLVGLYENPESFRLYVNLRSAVLNPSEILMYAGGGITKDSHPEVEWEETERKLGTLLNII